MGLPAEIRFIQRGWLNCNSILIQGGDGPVIVDTGHPQDADETVRLVRRAGVDPASLRLIVATHCHLDHHGGNAALQRQLSRGAATTPQGALLFGGSDGINVYHPRHGDHTIDLSIAKTTVAATG